MGIKNKDIEVATIATSLEQSLHTLFDYLSNLISNQDKIDCYSKTGEVISNDKEEVIAGRVYVDSEDVWITIAQIDHIGASYHLGNKASSPFGKYKGKHISISISREEV